MIFFGSRLNSELY